MNTATPCPPLAVRVADHRLPTRSRLVATLLLTLLGLFQPLAAAVPLSFPSLLSLQPADGTAAVPVDQPIIARFDRSMDLNCQVRLVDGFGAPRAGQTAWSQTVHPNDTLTFVPAAPLRHSMAYQLTLSGCRDIAGAALTGYERPLLSAFSSVGGSGDDSAPQVTTSAPYAGQRGADRRPLRILFDKPIDPATLGLGAVLLTGAGSPTYRVEPAGFGLNIWPQILQPQADYQLVLSGALADAEGHPLATPFSLKFTTGSGDTTAPAVVQTLPADGSNALEWEPVAVYFSEGMDAATITGSTVRVVDETADGSPVALHLDTGAVALDGGRAKLEIDSAVADGGRWQVDHRYRIELDPAITDLAGNALAGVEAVRFTVVRSGPGAPMAPPSLVVGESLAIRQPDGRVTLALALAAAGNGGGTVMVDVADLTQPGKVWRNLAAQGGQYRYTTPERQDEALVPGAHQLQITATDQSNGQSRTLLWSFQVFDGVPQLTDGPADQASNVSVQPGFSFTTADVTGAAGFRLTVAADAGGDPVFQTTVFPNADTRYSVQIPPSQALEPDTGYHWWVTAVDSLDGESGRAQSEQRSFMAGSGSGRGRAAITAPAADVFGKMTGTVTDAAGAPLAGAQITVYSEWTLGGWLIRLIGFTGPDGTYIVDGLETGIYRVCFGGPDSENYVSECYNNVARVDSGADIAVSAGQTTRNINAQLALGGAISGTVTGPTGDPLADIGVDVFTWNASQNYWEWVTIADTASDGTYTLGGLRTGTYRVCFDLYGGSFSDECYNNAATVDSGFDISVSAGQTTRNINVQLALGGAITGAVTGPTGDPLADTSVTGFTWNASQNYWEPVTFANTASDGTYTLGGLSTGTYRVCFYPFGGSYIDECYNNAATVDSGADISVSAGQTTGNINAQLAFGGTITGTVTGATGNSLAGISVKALTWNASRSSWESVTYADTAPDGTYTLGGLRTGTYRVCFSQFGGSYLDECYNNAATVYSGADISVSAGQTTGNINAQLALGGTITGTVTGATGNPLAGILVEAWIADQYGWGRLMPGTDTASDGTYTLGGLRTGTYRVCFSGNPGSGYANECYDNVMTLDSAADLVVAAAQTKTRVDAQLERAGHVTGIVTGPTGDGLSSIGVYAMVWNADVHQWQQVYDADTDTGAEGSYDLGTLRAGTYRICFRDWRFPEVYAGECYSNAATVASGTNVTVKVHQPRTGIDAQLALAGGPTLSVTDVRQSEGQAGMSTFVFAVTLSRASDTPVTVKYATANRTAVAGRDYTAAANTLIFAPGETSKTIAVNVIGDTMVEANESFVLNLTRPTNAKLADARGRGTIINDDNWPVLRIDDVSQPEGHSTSSPLNFTVTLSTAASFPVTVKYATANRTALAGRDYTAAANTLTFAPGETSKTVPVTVNGDTVVEANETFVVNLTRPTKAILADARGRGTIINDD